MNTPRKLRYPTEHATLALTLAISGFVVLAFSSFTLGGILLLVIIGFAVNAFSIFSSVNRIKRAAAPVSRLPEVEQVVMECKAKLGIDEEIEVFVANASTINAYAIGLTRPYAIVLYTGLIQTMDRDELAFVIGHEMGHVKLRHTRILGIIGQLGMQTYGVPILGMLLRYIFLVWMRVGEYSADRAGLVACGRLDKALSTQLKLSLGPRKARGIDIRSIVAHWTENDVSVSSQLGDVLSTHPGLDARLDKLVDFARSAG